MLEKVNVTQKLNLFTDYCRPRIAGELNGQYVKLVKMQGEFIWHHHETEDELFLVVKGRLTMRLRDGAVELGEGEFLIVPAGVEHQPYAEHETHLLVFEPKTTLNTGTEVNARTVVDLERI